MNIGRGEWGRNRGEERRWEEEKGKGNIGREGEKIRGEGEEYSIR